MGTKGVNDNRVLLGYFFKYSLLLLFILSIACSSGVTELTLRTRSRLYPGYKQDHKVKLNEKFNIADTDIEAVAVEFYPDFSIDTLLHQVYSRSDSLRNPAVKVLVIQNKEKIDEVWAFPPSTVPHFSPRSFIGFELIDFKTGRRYHKIAPSKK